MNLVLLPLLSSILLTLSSPGIDLWYLSFFSFIPILFSINDKKFIIIKSLIFSITYYFYNVFWLNSSVSHFGGAPLIVGLLVVLAMSFYLSIYMLLFFYLNSKTDKIYIGAVVFVIIEIIRGKIFTGFPWLNLGLIPYNSVFFTNLYSIFGEYGISFIIILVNLSIFKFVSTRKIKHLSSLGIIFILIIISNIMNTDTQSNKKLKVSIIQPNYKQEEKWLPEKRETIKTDVLTLLLDAFKTDSNLILLPESVFPFFIQADNATFNTFRNLSENKDIIVGNIRYDSKLNYYNSTFFFSKGNVDFYDKIHLVPFGEYFPLKIITAPISKYFFGDAKDFSRGKSVKIFKSNDINILPLLCYESAFYNILYDGFKKFSPDVLAVFTNDSWFGDTVGRYQHLAIDIVRAKEFSKPLVRVTQSGISACIDEKGQILQKLDNHIRSILNCEIGINSNKTSIFSKYGYLWLGILSLLIIILNIKKSNNG